MFKPEPISDSIEYFELTFLTFMPFVVTVMTNLHVLMGDEKLLRPIVIAEETAD